MSVQNVSSYTPSLLRLAIEARDAQRALSVIQSKESCPDEEGGCTNLIRAIQYCPENLTLIQSLITGRGREIIEFRASDGGDTAMLKAAQLANAAVIDLLARAGASVNGTGVGIGAPLYRAAIFSSNALCMRGSNQESAFLKTLEAVRVLLEHGASMDLLQSTQCPLLLDYINTVWQPDPNLVTFLVEEGVPLLDKENVANLPPEQAKTIEAAITAGLQLKAARNETRVAATKELGSTFPAPLMALIHGYI